MDLQCLKALAEVMITVAMSTVITVVVVLVKSTQRKRKVWLSGQSACSLSTCSADM